MVFKYFSFTKQVHPVLWNSEDHLSSCIIHNKVVNYLSKFHVHQTSITDIDAQTGRHSTPDCAVVDGNDLEVECRVVRVDVVV